MTDPISRIAGVSTASAARRVSRRRGAEPARAAAGDEEIVDEVRLPAVVDPPPAPPPRSRRAALAAFAAQLLGQGGQKRGLRGGSETLDKARNAYLEAEWSGPADRRLRSGAITKTDV